MQVFVRLLQINSLTDIMLSKTQLSKMIQSGGFLGRFLGPLLRTGLPFMKNLIKPSAKSALIPLGLTAAASAAGDGIHHICLNLSKISAVNLLDSGVVKYLS